VSSFYILYSNSLDKFYTGITTESVEVRLEKHNSGAYGKKYTSAATDWILQLDLKAGDYAHARRMEIYVKKQKSRSYTLSLIHSEIEQKQLFEKTIQHG
jgi:putative endonuclease